MEGWCVIWRIFGTSLCLSRKIDDWPFEALVGWQFKEQTNLELCYEISPLHAWKKRNSIIFEEKLSPIDYFCNSFQHLLGGAQTIESYFVTAVPRDCKRLEASSCVAPSGEVPLPPGL